MSKIKICGLYRPCDIDYVNEFLPDYIGFVFYERSHRNVTPAQALSLKERLSPEIKAVGVFVNEPFDSICAVAGSGAVDLIQLHGDEDAAYAEAVRRETGLPLIRAVRVRNGRDIDAVRGYPCDYLLLDTYSSDKVGGTGATFDHSVIGNVEKPFFLAGGITAENLPRALEVEPYCVDISSGAETDGFKDREKIKRIMEIIERSNCNGQG